MLRPSRELKPHEVRRLNKYAADFDPPLRFETERETVLEKAHRLLEEGRVCLAGEWFTPKGGQADVQGDTGTHTVTLTHPFMRTTWDCTCHAFQAGNECSHILAAKMAAGVKP